MEQLVEVSLDLIDDHPDNPRITFREDVIDAIAMGINGAFQQKHAVHVRPTGDRYQLLAGHHRKRAAQRRGLAKIWAWVEDMDDEAAHMALATSNNQGELSPLEIGMHALKAVPVAKGGRGKKGGLSEYAERIGKGLSTVSEYRSAAEVLVANPSVDRSVFLDKAQHLAAVHKLPRECWQAAAEKIAEGSMSAADTQSAVDGALAFLETKAIGKQWLKHYLPLNACAARVFCGTDANSFYRLSSLATEVHDKLAANHKDLAEAWRQWLEDNSGFDSWNIQKVREKQTELEDEAWERDNADTEEESDEVTLLLADPPWRYDFAETDSRQIENQYPTADAEEIVEHIKRPWMPPLAEDCVLFLWATAPKLREALEVMDGWGFTYKTHAVWDKEKIGMGYWFRGQHELLLVGTRGSASPPDAANRVASVFREARTEHSRKPVCVYEAIERMFPGGRKCEMYQRQPRQGWIGVGNEASKG